MKYFFVTSKDKRSNDVRRWIEKFRLATAKTDYPAIRIVSQLSLADKIIVTGGDGTILHAIRKYADRGKPFLGINRGTRGFLLNPIKNFKDFAFLLTNFDQHKLIELNLLKATFIKNDGKKITARAFNDVFLNALPGTAVTGNIKGGNGFHQNFKGDGIIIATPQGSTAYNHSAGGSILPLGHDIIAVTTNNPSTKPIRVSISSQKIVINIERGNTVAHADNKRVNNVKRIIIEPSKVAVKLAFIRDYDFEAERYCP